MRLPPGIALVTPMVVFSTLFFFVPLLVLALVSVTGWPMRAPNLDAYAKFFGEPFNQRVLWNTIMLGVKTVALMTLIGLPIAFMFLHGGRKLRQFLAFMTLLPMLTSSVVRTFAWLVILGKEGVINASLLELGLTNVPIRLLYTEFGLILALTQMELPLLLLPLFAVLSRLEQRDMEAAATLGAGSWRILITIILPRAIPGVLAGWILVFSSATTSFVTQGVIGGARNIYLPLFVYQQVGSLFNWQFAAVVALVLLISSGTVMIGLTLLGRHRRLVSYA